MKLLFDINVAVDLFAERLPHVRQVLQLLQVTRRQGVSCYLYTGSVQTLHFVLARTIQQSNQSFSAALSRAAAVLAKADRTFLWWSALSEDAQVFSAEDPEDAQLLKAVERMGDDALLISRDAELVERSPRVVTPEEYLRQVAEKDGNDKMESLEFCDLAAQLNSIRPQMERAMLDVVESTKYIKGPPVARLEKELSDYLGGSMEAIGCASGTDALLIAMMALGVQPGDEIIIPDFTFIATGEVVSFLGAIPVFCDVDPASYNLDPAKIEAQITEKTVGIVPVSLFGQVADMDPINALAEKHGLWVMEDGAQSFGAEYRGRPSCSLSRVATTSFFPAKPLGCYGDGGAIFTTDSQLAEDIRVILNHGQIKRYHHAKIGLNGRMDTLQAAVLSVKLRHFDDELELREQAARAYTERLAGAVTTPTIAEHSTRRSWAQYTIQVEGRDALRQRLSEKGVPTAVHYPVPLSRQEAFAYLGRGGAQSAGSSGGYGGATEAGGDAQGGGAPGNPVTEELSRRVLSLPMHPFLSTEDIDTVSRAVKDSLE